jgi:hypothetical protein
MDEAKPERNPNTHQKHRRDVFWQITVPLIIGGAIIISFAVLSVITATNGGNVSQAADTSLIFLIVPVLIVAFLLLVFLAAFAYGIIWLNINLPPYFYQAQQFMVRLQNIIRLWADKAVEPILRLESAMASLKALKRK